MLNLEELRQSGENVPKLTAALGGLAPFCLDRRLRNEQDLQPDFAPEPGAAWVLCVWEDALSNLEKGFALPLCWKKGAEDSDGLPKSFRSIAGQVRDALGISGYGLELGRAIEGTNLSRLDIGAFSAFAPLAAALIVLVEGGVPRPWVFATGQLEGDRISEVRGIGEKVEAIRSYLPYLGIPDDKKAVLWVPYGNLKEARDAAAGGMDVKAYKFTSQHQGNQKKLSDQLEDVLSEHLSDLEKPPGQTESLDKRLKYANRKYIVGNKNLRDNYYRKHLFAELVAKLSQNCLPDDWQKGRGSLATCVGGNVPVTALGCLALAPRRALVLRTDGAKPRTWHDELKAQCGKMEMESIALDETLSDDAGSRIREIVRFLENEPDRRLRAVDITPGTREMSALLLAAAWRADARVFYIRHTMGFFNQPKYGTEKIVELDWVLRNASDR